MKKRKSIVVSAILCMCSICLLMFGVYAASSPTINLSGKVSYVARDARVLVQGAVQTNKLRSDTDFQVFEYLNSVPDDQDLVGASLAKTSGDKYCSWTPGLAADESEDLAPWTDLNLKFEESADGIKPISLGFQLSNYSNYPVVATIDLKTVSFQNVVADLSEEEVYLLPYSNGPSTKQVVVTYTVESDSTDASGIIDVQISFEKPEALPQPTAEGLAYTVDETSNECTVTGYTGEASTLVMPQSIEYKQNQYPITKIASYAFKDNTSLKSIVLPDTITEVDWTAFSGCTGLKNRKNLDNGAYYVGTSNNNHFVLLSAESKGITQCVIHSETKVLGIQAFYECSQLKQITVPNGITEINNGVFGKCTGLESVVLPEGISVASNAFSGCSALISQGGAVYFGTEDNPFYYLYKADSDITTFSANANCKVICDSAFYNRSDLTSVTLPSGLISIGEHAFNSCKKLSGISIPSTVKTVGRYAFAYCSALSGTVALPDDLDIVEEGLFRRCTSLSKIVLPTLAKEIKTNAFEGCTGLTGTLTIPANVCEIGESAFSGCTSVSETLAIPNSIQYVRKKAFANCDAITKIEIGKGLEEIESEGFAYCDNLTSVIFDDDCNVRFAVDSWNGAFNGCEKLTFTTSNNVKYLPSKNNSYFLYYKDTADTGSRSITINSNCKIIAGKASYESKIGYEVSLPSGLRVIGDQAFYNSNYIDDVKFPTKFDNLVYFGNSVFGSCDELFSANDFPTNMKEIPEGIFSGTDLRNVTIPEGVESIGRNAFYDCGSLTAVTFPSTLKTIGAGAFCDTGLKSLTLPNNLETIEGRAFATTVFSETALTGTLNLPSSLKKIGESAFEGCSKLTGKLTLPEGLTYLGESAFEKCTGFSESVVIPQSLNSLGLGCFDESGITDIYVSSLNQWLDMQFVGYGQGVLSPTSKLYVNNQFITEISVPDNVTVLKKGQFGNCTQLTNVTLPASLESLGDYAFYGCTGLTNVNLPEKLTNIGEQAFQNCSSLQSINIPQSVKKIGEDAFYGCSSLTGVYITDMKKWCKIDFEFSYQYSTCNGNFSNPLYYAKNLYLNGNLVTDLEIPEGITQLNNCVFVNATCLKSVTVPTSLTKSKINAFYGCTNLESVYIKDLTKWCNVDFESYHYSGDRLEPSLDLEDASPFNYAKKLYLNNALVTDLVIPAEIGTLSQYCFGSCSCFTSVTFQTETPQYGWENIAKLDNVTKVYVPSETAKQKYTSDTSDQTVQDKISVA